MVKEEVLAWFNRHPVSYADLSALVDGALAGPRLARISAHLDGCETCRADVARLQELKGQVGGLARPAAPRSFTLSAERAGTRTPPAPRPTPRYALVPAAALAVLLLLLGADFAVFPAGKQQTSQQASAPASAKSAGVAADSLGLRAETAADQSTAAQRPAAP